ncbi:hypothetical protein HDU67_002556 [Dinochytrium kinnereticum]|nr:hypothetical protein HDU67_002556 [Dinochytrium kinnereticum]
MLASDPNAAHIDKAKEASQRAKDIVEHVRGLDGVLADGVLRNKTSTTAPGIATTPTSIDMYGTSRGHPLHSTNTSHQQLGGFLKVG